MRKKIGRHWWEKDINGNWQLSPTKRKLKKKSDIGPYIKDDLYGLY